MPDSSQLYRVQWKGVESGPHTREELGEMLRREEISLLHRVLVDGKWKSLGEFLGHHPAYGHQPRVKFVADVVEDEDAIDDGDAVGRVFDASSAVTAPPAMQGASVPAEVEKVARLGYALCGAAFVVSCILCSFSVLVALFGIVPALIAALYLHLNGGREAARLQFILGPALGVLGILFSRLIDFAEKSGWLDLH
ncbi:MAG: hypothetical protein LBD01_05045 [Puniceicoccales bacterium]|nr:hypothetical protein [Puniceicoccales bacterium]